MSFLMKLNIWIGFIAAISGNLIMRFVRAYVKEIFKKKYEVDEEGCIVDYKIVKISVVWFERIYDFTSGVIIGVIFWALPFTGMIAK